MELKVEHLNKAYGEVIVLDDVSFSLEKGQKIGLVGNNGTGKSTLFKIIIGLVEQDSGIVQCRKGLRIGYMPQDTSLVSEETINTYLRRVSGMGVLEENLGKSSEALAEYENRNGYVFDYRMQVTLAGFGLKDIPGDRQINSLSSGQKSKVFMAGVLLSDPDVLLLDEPTNNLDLSALIWLEDFIVRSEFACIIVSHDRLFLDRVVRKIFEINWHSKTLAITNGKYSDYLARLEKERERQRMAHDAQQEEISRLSESARIKKVEATQGASFKGSDNDKFLRGFKRDRASKSGKAAKAIEKRIEQMEIIERPVERDLFRITLESERPYGSSDIVLRDVVAGYPEGGFRIGPITATISYGNRVVILGLNGSGKSTFLNTISGKIKPISGDVVIGSSLIIGNLMQEHDNLPRGEILKDFLMERAKIGVQETYALIVKFGFQAEEINKDIASFSPGGRARILLALFSVLSVNVLLLDEPTNHLDLEAIEAVEEAVSHYKGTIVLVSHDRYFLEKFSAIDTYILSEGQLTLQKDFKAYLLNAEREAKRLINLL